MSDQPEAPDVDTSVEDDQSPEAEEQTFSLDHVKSLREEAKNYRTQLREAESTVEKLRTVQFDRAIMDASENTLADSVTPHDVRNYLDVNKYVTEDGDPDPDSLRSAVLHLSKDKPHLGKSNQHMNRLPRENLRLISGATGRAPEKKPDTEWSKVLGPGNEGARSQ